MSSTLSGKSSFPSDSRNVARRSDKERSREKAQNHSSSKIVDFWYRVPPDFKSNGPFSMDEMMASYKHHEIHPHSEISTDNGMNWISLRKLRCLNGPSTPFNFVNGDIAPRCNLPQQTDDLSWNMKRVRDVRRQVGEMEYFVDEMSRVLNKELDRIGRMNEVGGVESTNFDEWNNKMGKSITQPATKKLRGKKKKKKRENQTSNKNSVNGNVNVHIERERDDEEESESLEEEAENGDLIEKCENEQPTEASGNAPNEVKESPCEMEKD
ncbi:hypothetical protein PFISCL1PPCAC_27213, partial [Pristionchus fissidentatus]